MTPTSCVCFFGLTVVEASLARRVGKSVLFCSAHSPICRQLAMPSVRLLCCVTGAVFMPTG